MSTTDWIIAMSAMLFLPVTLIPISLLMVKLGRGYNTFGRAGLTREAQSFAARMIGRLLLRVSLIALVLILAGGGIGLAFLENETITTVIIWIVVAVPLVLVIIPVILTEISVRKHFDKNGRPYKS